MFDRLQNDQAVDFYSFQLPGSCPHYLPDQQGHLSHVSLNLHLDIPKRSLEGASTLYITPVRADTHQLTLDAVNLIIDYVMINQIQQPFDYDGKRLYIRLNKPTKSNDHPFELTIAYRAEAPRQGSETALHLIFDDTAAGIAQPLRLAAIRQLGVFAAGQAPANQERILDRLEALSWEDFFLTQVAVVAALEKIQRARAITILQSLSAQALDGRVRRYADEAIRVVQKAVRPDQATHQLRQELETLKQENQQLCSRLEKLEAKVS